MRDSLQMIISETLFAEKLNGREFPRHNSFAIWDSSATLIRGLGS